MEGSSRTKTVITGAVVLGLVVAIWFLARPPIVEIARGDIV